jgi:hypothetical protein
LELSHADYNFQVVSSRQMLLEKKILSLGKM